MKPSAVATLRKQLNTYSDPSLNALDVSGTVKRVIDSGFQEELLSRAQHAFQHEGLISDCLAISARVISNLSEIHQLDVRAIEQKLAFRRQRQTLAAHEEFVARSQALGSVTGLVDSARAAAVSAAHTLSPFLATSGVAWSAIQGNAETRHAIDTELQNGLNAGESWWLQQAELLAADQGPLDHSDRVRRLLRLLEQDLEVLIRRCRLLELGLRRLGFAKDRLKDVVVSAADPLGEILLWIRDLARWYQELEWQSLICDYCVSFSQPSPFGREISGGDERIFKNRMSEGLPFEFALGEKDFRHFPNARVLAVAVVISLTKSALVESGDLQAGAEVQAPDQPLEGSIGYQLPVILIGSVGIRQPKGLFVWDGSSVYSNISPLGEWKVKIRQNAISSRPLSLVQELRGVELHLRLKYSRSGA